MESDLTEGQAELAMGLSKETSVNVKAQMVLFEAENVVDPENEIRKEHGRDALLEDVVLRDRVVSEAFGILSILVAEDKITDEEANPIYQEVLRIAGGE